MILFDKISKSKEHSVQAAMCHLKGVCSNGKWFEMSFQANNTQTPTNHDEHSNSNIHGEGTPECW